jgi:hypothetical protein
MNSTEPLASYFARTKECTKIASRVGGVPVSDKEVAIRSSVGADGYEFRVLVP